MLRRRIFIITLLVLTSAVWFMPARAAGTPWTAWLYDETSGRMTQVDDTGATLHQFVLPAAAGSMYSRNIAISADGLLLAYTAANTSGTTFNLYNLTSNSVIYNLMLPPDITTSFEFSGNSFNFSDGSSTVAFSYAKFETAWQIVVIDVNTFSAVVLKEDDPVAASISSPAFGFMLPVVMYNRNQDIKFMMIALGTDGSRSYDAYTWNTARNAITPDDAYITPDTDTLASTNDVIISLSDPRFPESDDPLSGYPSSNTLQVFDSTLNERYVVTSLPRVYNPRFIQGGERVGARLFEYFPDGSPNNSLLVLDRSGALSGTVDIDPTLTITDVLGTPNGFIFTANNNGAVIGATLYYVETRLASSPYAPVSIWTSTPGQGARLVWVSDSASPTASSFPAWGRVAVPATGVPTISASGLIIGGQAQVQTTGGDVLNLRGGPARSFPRLGTVGNGTVVTILEGSNNGDDLTWWRIRLPTGVEGWVVDAADGVQTLIPR